MVLARAERGYFSSMRVSKHRTALLYQQMCGSTLLSCMNPRSAAAPLWTGVGAAGAALQTECCCHHRTIEAGSWDNKSPSSNCQAVGGKPRRMGSCLDWLCTLQRASYIGALTRHTACNDSGSREPNVSATQTQIRRIFDLPNTLQH
jgi:hypothetical protein